MISIVSAVITLLLAISGVFFSKHGERNKINWVGWVILGFILIGGMVTILQAANTSSKNAAQARQITEAGKSIELANRQLISASRRISYLEGELSDAQEEMLQLTAPSLSAFKHLTFSFRSITSDDENASGDLPGYVGPIPIKTKEVKSFELDIDIQDTVDANFTFEKKGNDLLLREVPGFGSAETVSKIENCTAQCYEEVKGKYWTSEALNEDYYETINLTSEKSGSMLVALLVKHRGVGSIIIEHEKGFDAKAFEGFINNNFPMELKVYGKKSADCSPIIVGSYALSLSKDTESETQYDIEKSGRLHYASCEEVPD